MLSENGQCQGRGNMGGQLIPDTRCSGWHRFWSSHWCLPQWCRYGNIEEEDQSDIPTFMSWRRHCLADPYTQAPQLQFVHSPALGAITFARHKVAVSVNFRAKRPQLLLLHDPKFLVIGACMHIQLVSNLQTQTAHLIVQQDVCMRLETGCSRVETILSYTICPRPPVSPALNSYTVFELHVYMYR